MNLNCASYWRRLASGGDVTIAGRCLLGALIPFSQVYAAVQSVRGWLYRRGIVPTRTLPRPVVSIGNLTVGGTGKTPVTAWIARYLQGNGYRVAIVSRGYGGSLEGKVALVSDGVSLFLSAAECGDEPYLLARSLPGVTVVIGSNRHAAGCLALARCQPDIFLLDDGFQHLRLKRDLNIVLLDAANPYGNGWTLPAGLLREPVTALRRGDLIIRTRCQDVERPLGEISLPSCRARHLLSDVLSLTGGDPSPLASLYGKRCLAFAGIAEPESFFAGLRQAGVELVATAVFPDHIRYGETQLLQIADCMKQSGAELALTTEKDGVKLLPFGDSTRQILQVRLQLELDHPELLTNALQALPPPTYHHKGELSC